MKKLLLVEDNALNRNMLSTVLERMGYEVLLAVNGQEGVEMARTHLPTLVLMDINMPVMDGWEALKVLKEDPATTHIPIVALTAHDLTSDSDKAGEIGFNAYASKPIDLPTLVQTVETLIQTTATDHD